MSDWIMLVDDEPHLLIATAHRLRSCGYHVLTARDGGEALTIARNRKLNLIILDIRMPDMDGFETFEQLQTLPDCREVPVIFLTANAQPDNRQRARDLGSRFILQKPCESSLLIDAVKEALNTTV